MRPRKLTWLAAALLILAAVGVCIGGVAAYLSATTGPVVNTFTPDTAGQPTILETFENNVKSNVAVDIGTPGYAVYVRVAIVATWQKNGAIHWEKPVGGTVDDTDIDYVLDWNDADWFYNPNDGFYYCKAMVNSGQDTAVLIKECYQKQKGPDGYSLHVEIIAQTIQALGSTDDGDTPAVTDAWGVGVGTDKKLIDPTT